MQTANQDFIPELFEVSFDMLKRKRSANRKPKRSSDRRPKKIINRQPLKQVTEAPSIPSAETLKMGIDNERRELDRLDIHGGSQIASHYCAKRIEVLVNKLKQLHGIDY